MYSLARHTLPKLEATFADYFCQRSPQRADCAACIFTGNSIITVGWRVPSCKAYKCSQPAFSPFHPFLTLTQVEVAFCNRSVLGVLLLSSFKIQIHRSHGVHWQIVVYETHGPIMNECMTQENASFSGICSVVRISVAHRTWIWALGRYYGNWRERMPPGEH